MAPGRCHAQNRRPQIHIHCENFSPNQFYPPIKFAAEPRGKGVYIVWTTLKSKLKWNATTTLVLIVVAIWCWWAVSPRYQLPKELNDKPCSMFLNKRLASVTKNQSLIRTDASLKDLRQHQRLGTEFSVLTGSPLESLGFYWTTLRRSSLFLIGGPSAPYRDFVCVVNADEQEQVWFITRENRAEDFVTFLNDLNFVISDENDARLLGTLWHLLIPRPVPEFKVMMAGEDAWICTYAERNATVQILFSIDSSGLLSGAEARVHR